MTHQVLSSHHPDSLVVRGYKGIALDLESLDNGRNLGGHNLACRGFILDVGNNAIGTPVLKPGQGAIPTTGFPVKRPGTLEIGVLGNAELKLASILPGCFE